MIDSLLAEAKASGSPLEGPEGLLNRMTKAVLERALSEEMTDHLGYESGDPDGAGTGNSRNGNGRKTVSTVNGPVELRVPRDRDGSFEPRIVPKHARRLGNVNDMILSLEMSLGQFIACAAVMGTTLALAFTAGYALYKVLGP